MVFDHQRPNLCNTILSLGLGYINTTNHPSDYDYDDHNRNRNHNHALLPSLSLALPSDRETLDTMDPDSSTSNLIAHQQKQRYQKDDSSGSASVVALSSSRSSVKREISRDQEEVEEGRVDYYSVKNDQEQDEEGPRKKLRLTKEQSFVLEESFKEHSTLSPKQKQSLASKLNLRARQVEVWFQNRRARTKLKQTEMEFDILKKCCETLKDENKRLHKEVQELKAMKVPLQAAPPPFYMQFPAATLSMCPSCESLSSGAGGSGDQNPSRISFSRSAKSARFYNPFANHPSAAC